MVALSPLPWHLFPGTPMCVDREEQNQFLKTMGLLNVVHAFFATEIELCRIINRLWHLAKPQTRIAVHTAYSDMCSKHHGVVFFFFGNVVVIIEIVWCGMVWCGVRH